MTDADTASRLLAASWPQYRPRPGQIESLGGAGGFSGARFWRIETAQGRLCLRRWPAEHPTPDRLRFIHAVLQHAVANRFDRLPVPVRTADGNTFTELAGALWQLEPWMPGTASSAFGPAPRKIRAAMTTLAEFHQATVSFPAPPTSSVVSPGIQMRRRRLRSLLGGHASQIEARIAAGGGWPEVRRQATELLRLFRLAATAGAERLEAAAGVRVRLQPCLRDIWSQHVLFVGHRVTALIDFGALRYESVAADVARLLGSLALDDSRGWREGLQAYETVRPLSVDEKRLLAAFDQSTVLLAGMNWIEWIFWEKRQFEDPAAVQQRLEQILTRLAAAGRGAWGLGLPMF